ncbi:MAG: pentapeptide repeat-containing protein [Hyphomonas sp.]|nr:pentapeptide repeat-containing protein [Hyphomonas sp.]
MTRLVYAFLAVSTLSLAALPATAQGQPVAWSPGYTGTCGECDLSGTNLTGWTLTGGNYSRAKLEFAFMRGVQAGNANFEHADATKADMRGAILTSARFSGATLSDARLQGIQASGADFRSANVRGANLQGALLVGTNFASADLTASRMETADLSGANLTGTWLNDTTLTGTIFNGANMTGAQLRNSTVESASFKDVRFIDADLTGLRGAELADFEGACVSLSTLLPSTLTLPLCGTAKASAAIASK